VDKFATCCIPPSIIIPLQGDIILILDTNESKSDPICFPNSREKRKHFMEERIIFKHAVKENFAMTVKENRMIGTHSQYMGCAFSSDVKENNACAKRNFINGKGNDVIVLSKNGSVLLFSLSPTIEEHPE